MQDRFGKIKTKTSSQVTKVPALDTCHVLLMPTVAQVIVPHFFGQDIFFLPFQKEKRQNK